MICVIRETKFYMMKSLVYILIGLFVLCGTSNNAHGQFWKKKNNTSKKADSFSSKSKKGPNIKSSKGPRGKDKGSAYEHSVSKKKFKGKKGSGFSSTKRRYKSALNTKSSGKGDRNSSGGRKSGKGRRKEK